MVISLNILLLVIKPDFLALCNWGSHFSQCWLFWNLLDTQVSLLKEECSVHAPLPLVTTWTFYASSTLQQGSMREMWRSMKGFFLTKREIKLRYANSSALPGEHWNMLIPATVYKGFASWTSGDLNPSLHRTNSVFFRSTWAGRTLSMLVKTGACKEVLERHILLREPGC